MTLNLVILFCHSFLFFMLKYKSMGFSIRFRVQGNWNRKSNITWHVKSKWPTIWMDNVLRKFITIISNNLEKYWKNWTWKVSDVIGWRRGWRCDWSCWRKKSWHWTDKYDVDGGMIGWLSPIYWIYFCLTFSIANYSLK